MKTVRIGSIPEGERAYIFTEIGDGQLEEVASFNPHDGWVRCYYCERRYTRSYLVCNNEPAYIFDTGFEAAVYERERQEQLQARRERWNNGVFA